MPKLTRRQKISLAGTSLFLALAAWLAIAYLLQEQYRHITVSRETTFFTSPLRPDGTVDFLAAINAHCSAGVTPANNAAVILLQATGSKDIIAPARKPLFFSRLGIPEPPEPATPFLDYPDFMAARSPQPADEMEKRNRMQQWMDHAESRRLQPWHESEDPDIASWLRANQIPLQLTTDATRLDRLYFPLVGNPRLETVVDTSLPALGKCRSLATALLARAMMNLAAGNIPAYQTDLLAAARLGRLLMQGPTIIQRLVGLAILDQSLHAVEPALGNKMTPAQTQTFLAAIRDLKTIPDMLEPLDLGERAMVLDNITNVARFGPHMGDESTPIPQKESLGLQWIPVRFDDVLRQCNTLCDLRIRAAAQPTYAARETALHDASRACDAVSKREQASWSVLRRALDLLVQMSNFTISRYLALHDHLRMRRQLAELALLLELHRAATGSYPASLSLLDPAQIAGADEDFFSAGKMIYRPDSTGYLLYSVGINARDDAGQERPRATATSHSTPSASRPDDITLRVPPSVP